MLDVPALRGRASVEWSVCAAAFALLFPELALLGVAFAIRSRRHGSPRWLAALLASVWCGILGVIVRLYVHLGVAP
jgi:hypothetical protein